MNTIIQLLILFFSFLALGSPELPPQIKVGSKTLLLNGTGMREATVFKVDVYKAGLYLEKKSRVAKEILESPQTKQMVTHFVRDVGAEDIRNAWSDGIKNNYGFRDPSIQKNLDVLNSQMEDLKSGHILSITMTEDSVWVSLNGKQKSPIAGKTFPRAILENWIGENPPNSSLKEGLLGN